MGEVWTPLGCAQNFFGMRSICSGFIFYHVRPGEEEPQCQPRLLKRTLAKAYIPSFKPLPHTHSAMAQTVKMNKGIGNRENNVNARKDIGI